MSKIKFICTDGIGGLLQTLSCADIVQNQGNEVYIDMAVRNEIFGFMKEIFKDKFKNMGQIPEAFVEDYRLEKDDELWARLSRGEFDEVYFNCPDCLWRNKHRFNYKRYNVNLSDIRDHKLLENRHIPADNICYLALLSTTPGYTYVNASDLINFLCVQNPKWKFYMPNDYFWNGMKLHVDIRQKHSNLILEENPTIFKSWDWMQKSSFMITTDGGPMHIANHLGLEKLVIDPQYGRFAFISRWRRSMDDSIPSTTSAMDICRVAKNLLDNELARLVPRKFILDRLINGSIAWENELMYKF